MAIRSFDRIDPFIEDGAYVDQAATVIGDVAIGPQSSVWPGCVLRGDVQSIRIGARTNIQDGTIVHVTHDSEHSPGGYATTVGDDVTVGHRAILHACIVEDRVLVGMGTIVMDGAIVRSDVIIGAGALVPSHAELESGWLYVGTPAAAKRELTDEERDFLRYSAKHYTELAQRHAHDNDSKGDH